MRETLEDWRTLPPKDRALFAFLSAGDADGAKAAGWSEAALYDALTVRSLFAFYNAWVDGAGVAPLGEADALASGRRLARFGYLPPRC